MKVVGFGMTSRKNKNSKKSLLKSTDFTYIKGYKRDDVFNLQFQKLCRLKQQPHCHH